MATKKKAAPAKKAPAKKAFGAKAGGRFGAKAGAKKGARAPGEKRKGPRRKPAPPPATTRSPRGKRAAAPGRTSKAAVSAGPAPVELAPAAPAKPDEARPLAMAIARAGLDKKAEDVTVLDVRGLTSYADYFVVLTADSERQAGAIADHIDETLKAQGHTKVGVEGYEGGRWILVDYGDVVAHVMNKESRGFYDLEGLWADAPRFAVEG
jgi:ribosome-associated protein